jgi:hypothetical protein
MANYAVFLEGEDFELSHSGSKELLGFFVTVRVEAQSECEAKISGVTLVKSTGSVSIDYLYFAVIAMPNKSSQRAGVMRLKSVYIPSSQPSPSGRRDNIRKS